jgi:two-component system alkaline phosphatase synthesis response regulator PhoP
LKQIVNLKQEMDNSTVKILLVDDEADILDFVGYNLKAEGYQVFTANSGKSGVAKAKAVKPDLILLDVMMPEMDGIEACDQIKSIPELSSTIIAFLTARGEDYSQVAGFDAGADDYITKPVKPKVLTSRIKALLRRRPTSDQIVETSRMEFNGLVIDSERYHVELKGEVVDLPRKEFELLSLLASKPGKVFTREEIMVL